MLSSKAYFLYVGSLTKTVALAAKISATLCVSVAHW